MNKYKHIQNLEQLRIERMRIEEKISYKKNAIEQRYSSITSLFTREGITNYVSSYIVSAGTIVNSLRQGIEFARSLFTKTTK